MFVKKRKREQPPVGHEIWCIDAPYQNPLPLRWLYCTHITLSTFCIYVPAWTVLAIAGKMPKRPSWDLREQLIIPGLRRLSRMTDGAGMQFATRDPTKAPTGRLAETAFEWAQGLPDELATGMAVSHLVKPLKKVGMYVWEGSKASATTSARPPQPARRDTTEALLETSRSPEVPPGQWVGIYLHGGGYTHFSAHENSDTSQIPRRLMKTGAFSSIHSVEYRLLPAGPFPAALQDAASVYVHLLRAKKIPANRIVVIGDSAGGNCALALARWIRDEALLPTPAGMILLSPWADPSHSFKVVEHTSSPRPNGDTDYLSDIPAARKILIQTLLGNRDHSFVSSPYISPATSIKPAGSFDHFPPTFVNYGDAERLVPEIESLLQGYRRDNVPVQVEVTKDAPHDCLMMHWWPEKVRAGITLKIVEWLDSLEHKIQSDADFEL